MLYVTVTRQVTWLGLFQHASEFMHSNACTVCGYCPLVMHSHSLGRLTYKQFICHAIYQLECYTLHGIYIWTDTIHNTSHVKRRPNQKSIKCLIISMWPFYSIFRKLCGDSSPWFLLPRTGRQPWMSMIIHLQQHRGPNCRSIFNRRRDTFVNKDNQGGKL